MAELSSHLDGAADPSEGSATAEGLARRADEIGHAVEGFVAALNPPDALAAVFHRKAARVSRLIGNVVTKLKEFDRLLGTSSFRITFGTAPPNSRSRSPSAARDPGRGRAGAASHAPVRAADRIARYIEVPVSIGVGPVRHP